MLTYDFLLLGDYFFDNIYTGLGKMPSLGCELYCQDLTTTGGAMYITAVAMRRLGARVGWAGCFGDDYYSRHVYELALREDLDMALARQLQKPYRRVTTSLALEGERAFITFCDPDEPDLLHYYHACTQLCSFRHLHFGGLTTLEEARPLIEAARAQGATISMDCQDTPLLHTDYCCKALLKEIDIFMPNAREAKIMTKADTIQDALEWLRRECQLAVVKDGEQGAWAVRGNETAHASAMPVEQVIDTTGAGDCFNAGFLMAHIVEKQPLETCLRYGNICGGYSVGGVGGATKAPTYEQLSATLGMLPA